MNRYRIVRVKAIYEERVVCSKIDEETDNLMAARLKYREELNAKNVMFVYHEQEEQQDCVDTK